MAISLTSWAYVAVHAPQTPMAMGYVMTLTTALALTTPVVFATVLVRFTTAVVRRFQQVIAIVMAIS